MESLSLRISKRASGKLQDQVQWYVGRFDYSYVATLLHHFWEDVDMLCQMPTAGRRTDLRGRHEIRVFISHKKCIIKYWYDRRSLHVVDIVFTDTHSPRFF